jgi:hypothetical protein
MSSVPLSRSSPLRRLAYILSYYAPGLTNIIISTFDLFVLSLFLADDAIVSSFISPLYTLLDYRYG